MLGHNPTGLRIVPSRLTPPSTGVSHAEPIEPCPDRSLSVGNPLCGGLQGQYPSTPDDDEQPKVAPSQKDDGHGHAHERGKMLIVDAGKHHALLTAHLSPKGNELDIFIETASDKNPAPVAIPIASFKAFAKRVGEDQPTELTFDCAPSDERPTGEKAGTCSHFVAKTPWMKADEVLELTVPQLKMDDGVYRVVWKDFCLQKFAHHVE